MMKRKRSHIKILFLSSFIVYACRQNKQQEVSPAKDTVQPAAVKPGSANIKTDSHYYWGALTDTKTNRLIVKKLQPLSDDSLNADHLIKWINNKYDHVKLEFIKISNDTLFVKIRQSNYLTQQMGSTGADMYLTEATYNLTEINNIGYVHFDFKEGDHASPGTYSRTDFVNIRFSDQ